MRLQNTPESGESNKQINAQRSTPIPSVEDAWKRFTNRTGLSPEHSLPRPRTTFVPIIACRISLSHHAAQAHQLCEHFSPEISAGNRNFFAAIVFKLTAGFVRRATRHIYAGVEFTFFYVSGNSHRYVNKVQTQIRIGGMLAPTEFPYSGIQIAGVFPWPPD